MKNVITLNNKAIVSSKARVVISKKLRKKLGIHAGNELLFNVRVDGVIEVRQLERSMDMFCGRCKQVNEPPMSIEDMDKAIMQVVIKDEKKARNSFSSTITFLTMFQALARFA